QPCLAGRLPMQPRHIPLQPQTHISRNPGQRLDPPERSSSGERLPKIRTIGGATHRPDQTTGIFQGGVQHQPHPLPQSPAPIPGVDVTPVHLLEQFELAGGSVRPAPREPPTPAARRRWTPRSSPLEDSLPYLEHTFWVGQIQG